MKHLFLITILMITMQAKAGKLSCEGLFGLERPSEKKLIEMVSDLRGFKALLNVGNDVAKIEYPKKYQEALLVMSEEELIRRMKIGSTRKVIETEVDITPREEKREEIIGMYYIDVFLKEHGFSDINSQNEKGEIPIFKSAELGRMDLVEMMINRHVNFELKDKSGWILLHLAIAHGFTKIIEMMVNAKANFDLISPNGDTALQTAIHNYRWEIAFLLIEAGININLPNKAGSTPIYYAIEKEHVDLVRKLIAANVNVNHKDNKKRTALHTAVRKYDMGYPHDRNWRENIVRILIDAGVYVDLQDKEGRTALHEAAFGGHKEIVEILLAAGAKADIPDDKGKTPLDLAKEKGFNEIAEILEKASKK